MERMQHITSISEAQSRLPDLIALVQAGEEIVISEEGTPAVRLTACEKLQRKRAVPGALKGKIWMAEDFDELPPDIAAAFGMIDKPGDSKPEPGQ